MGVVWCSGGDFLLVVTHREEENLDFGQVNFQADDDDAREEKEGVEKRGEVQQKKTTTQLRKKAESFGVGPA
ncbi:unnamed protein product [Sphagnum troendelagicum]|uniref:LEAFY-like protein n=1 Tax=Sphagnum troendelagicum TaxID=128251 RepID=A0ABP0TS70_9BRYO